jgi:hypothetical protein
MHLRDEVGVIEGIEVEIVPGHRLSAPEVFALGALAQIRFEAAVT